MTFLTDTLQEATQALASVPVHAYIAVAVLIGAYIVQAILINKKIIYTGGQKKIAAAVADGRVAIARLERITHKGHRSDSNYYRFRGTYIYWVNGKQYRKGLVKESRNFVDPLRLYYGRNPANAKTAGEMCYWSEQVLPRVVPLLLAVLTYMILQ